ncbi:MAG: squalene--hopene cyclase [Dactylosporangium sp.]|nr:squalene--hopene cyclase [Dactylosporangium sp.]
MVDIEAAMGYVVAHGDDIDRARLTWLTAGRMPSVDALERVESGQTGSGGWPALSDSRVPSVDATCFRLGEIDDLGAIGRPAARQALAWLASVQQPDGRWEEDPSIAAQAPSWAQPGDPEAGLYLTARAAFWLAVSGPPPGATPAWGTSVEPNDHVDAVRLAAEAFTASLGPEGSWPSYLATGWFGGALLYHLGLYYESAQVQVALTDRVPEMSASDAAALGAAMGRVGMSAEDWLLTAVRRRLGQTQRTDGGWDSDDGPAFDVHATLTAIRTLR